MICGSRIKIQNLAKHMEKQNNQNARSIREKLQMYGNANSS